MNLSSKYYLILLIVINSVYCKRSESFSKKSHTCQNSKSATILFKIRQIMNNLHMNELNSSRPQPIHIEKIDVLLVPMNDEHFNEYVGDHDKRIEYLTNFTGSSGDVLITQTSALLWTDSRYHLQAEKQLNLDCWTLMKSGLPNVTTMNEWMVSNLQNKSKIGFDPHLMSYSKFKALSKIINDRHELISMDFNLVDKVWLKQPSLPVNQIIPFNIKYSGKRAGEKIVDLRKKLVDNNAEIIIISSLDDIAWLLNVRGSDITYNPVFYSYVIVTMSSLYIFIDNKKLTIESLAHLLDEGVDFEIRKYNEIFNEINIIMNNTNGNVLLSNDVNLAIYDRVPENRRHTTKSIVGLMKAIKNDVEAANIHKAHIRDGFALIRYLHWLDENIDFNNITELSGAKKLEEFRSESKNYRGISFAAISAYGAHAAMAHYLPTEDTDTQIKRDQMYLIDSGGQYWDGTTDVTRTVHFGKPSKLEKECFTRVLKGFIAYVTSIFPNNTALSYFDYMARRSLWQVGLDYGHGTGHGVGAYGLVHEYPPSVHANSGSDPGAQLNMFMSDEPGYYKDNEFGIRIEDVIQVVIASLPENSFFGQQGLTFKSVTYAPIQTKLINSKLLNKDEEIYVNKYNKNVFKIIGDILLEKKLMHTYVWLKKETEPIKTG